MTSKTKSIQKLVDPSDFKSSFLFNRTPVHPFSFEMENEEVPQTEAEASEMGLSEVMEG